jgi:hypothetical protein
VIVLATALLAVAASVIAGALIRHRRRRLLQERQELERLRSVVDVTDAEPAAPPPDAVDMRPEAPRTIRE